LFLCMCRSSDNNGGQKLDPPYGHLGLFLGDGAEAGGVCPRRASTAESESDPARVESAAVRPPRTGASRRLRGELHGFPREGVWRVGQPLHKGAPPLLQSGAAPPRPNSISQAAIFTVVWEGYLGKEP
jgi:hypothetical protein